MTTYDERVRAFEAAFAHDEELRFKAHAKRNHKLGLWAAAEMGKHGAEGEAYAQSLIDAGLQSAGDEGVIARLTADFTAAGVHQSHEQLLHMMSQFAAAAVAELKANPAV